MKTGTLTYHFANNYGACLQTFALQQFLINNNIDNIIINYYTHNQQNNNKLLKDWNIKGTVFNIVRFPFYFKRKLRIKKFDEFRYKNLFISNQLISDSIQLYNYLNKIDIDTIIVGSDQVWNPNTLDFEKEYFLKDLKNKYKIGYSVSIGNADIEQLEKFQNQINNFTKISVREISTRNKLKRFTDNDIAITLDPTMLLDKDFWYKYTSEFDYDNKYILCYFLGRKDFNKFYNCVKKLSKKFNLKIKIITANYGISAYNKNAILDAGPEDFLTLIRNASMVCTNSFHATAFSIIFNVPFYSFENGNVNDTRKSDILRRLELFERIIYNYDISSINTYFLDYSQTNKILSELREISYNYLLSNLNEDK